MAQPKFALPATGGLQPVSRWRAGERTPQARAAHNEDSRERHRDIAEAMFSEEDRQELLEELRLTGDVAKAARRLGVHHSTVYGRMSWDVDFAEQVEGILADYCQANIPACGSAKGYHNGGRCAQCRKAKRPPKPKSEGAAWIRAGLLRAQRRAAGHA